MIEIVTDSASMLPEEIRRRFAISVVPITITIDGLEHAEGIDLATDDFYRAMASGATISTSAPPPGRFRDTYAAAADRGANAVLSVHTGAAYSATVASATVAVDLVHLPVTIVDTGVGSFPVALAVWAAAEVIDRGGSIEQAAAVARRTAADAGSLFVVGVPAVARHGGRFVAVSGELTPTTVLELSRGELHARGEAADLDTAIETMIRHTTDLGGTHPLRIGVGHADRPEIAERIVFELTERLESSEIITYEVGPSVGAHTGPGTVGIVHAPL